VVVLRHTLDSSNTSTEPIPVWFILLILDDVILMSPLVNLSLSGAGLTLEVLVTVLTEVDLLS
jgi:hypothetical protein